MVLAERVARMVDHVPPAKRLADELEVLDAVRAVTTVNAEGVEAALSEIAERSAGALSCEFGAVVVVQDATSPPDRLARAAAGCAAEDAATTRETLSSSLSRGRDRARGRS